MKARTRIASRLGALAALVLLALFAGVGRAPSAAAGDSDAAGRTITVVGVGSATTTPDRATFAFGVVSRATTATRALAVNAAAIAKVVAALKAAGVAASDIQTTQVELAPRFKNGAAVSYTAASSVRATVRALDRAGAVVDAAVAAGANQVFGPALEPSDADAAYRKALREAVANARAKAQVLAEAAGLTLGPIVHVEETGEGEPASATAAPVAGGLEPGTQAIPASATLTFAVAQGREMLLNGVSTGQFGRAPGQSPGALKPAPTSGAQAVPLYGLSLYRGTHEDRAQLQSEEPIGVGEEFDYLGERWVVRSIEPSELGRVEAWLVCEPAEPPAQLHQLRLAAFER